MLSSKKENNFDETKISKQQIKIAINNINKSYKYFCKKCGAFVPLHQYICGMCMSSNRKKTSKLEKLQILEEYFIYLKKYLIV